MNNLTFGNDRYQYYETIASGSGAGDGFDGTDVVQTHMTNSRLTDPEVLEWRFPVRLDSYEIRRGSGGEGRYRGGSGGRRRLRFLEPMTATILSSHRRVAPYGMAGGAPGALGRAVDRARRRHGHRGGWSGLRRGRRRGPVRRRDPRWRRVRRAGVTAAERIGASAIRVRLSSQTLLREQLVEVRGLTACRGGRERGRVEPRAHELLAQQRGG